MTKIIYNPIDNLSLFNHSIFSQSPDNIPLFQIINRNKRSEKLGEDHGLYKKISNKFGKTIIAPRVLGYYATLVKIAHWRTGGNIANTPIDNDITSLLNKANEIHARAQQPNATEEEKQASQLLVLEEAKKWGELNKDHALLADEPKLVKAYCEQWNTIIQAPPNIKFETRKEIAERTGYSLDFGAFSGLDKIYYGQFFNHLTNYQEPFAKAKSLEIAQKNSLNWSAMNQEIERSWTIVELRTFNARTANIINTFGVNSRLFQGPGYLWQLKSGKFQFLRPNGEIYSFNTENPLDEYGNPRLGMIAKAMGETDSRDGAYKDMSYSKDPSGNIGKTIEEYLKKQAKTEMNLAIERIKDQNYDATSFQKFMCAIVPFLGIIVDAVNDPLSKPNVIDIYVDSLGLILMIGAAGALAIGKQGLKAIASGIKGLSGSAKVGRAFSITTRLILSPNGISTFGKEAIDFVIPIFTSADIIVGASRLRTKGFSSFAKYFATSASHILSPREEVGAPISSFWT